MFDLAAEQTKRCPDCGCTADRHNAVNSIGCGRLIAHCGGCGACWKSENTPFVAAVRLSLTGRDTTSTPNLQTIPIRTEAGEAIRKAFP